MKATRCLCACPSLGEEEMEVHEPEEETSEPETSRSRLLAFDELNGGDNESEGESQ